MSLRTRLFGYIVVGVLISTTLTVVIGYLLVQHRQSVQAQRVLGRQASVLASVSLASGNHVYVVRANRPGGVAALSAARAARILGAVPAKTSAEGQISVGPSQLFYAERDGPSGRVVVVRPARVAPNVPSFLLSLILAGIAGALVAAALAVTVARRLSRPLKELAQAARSLPGAERSLEVELAADAPEEVTVLGHAFNEMSRQVVEMRNAQRSFLLSVSHELKTPLTAIKGHAEGLQDGAVDPREAADVIAAESIRLERLIRDLLDLARLDQHAFAVSRVSVDLDQVGDQLLERFEGSARDFGVALRVERLAGGSAAAIADPDRVLQVASNLVENALRVTPEGGAVMIRLGHASLSVCDTGPGLADEDLLRAFDRFYLHQKLASHEDSGSGLGLAVVKELTEAMGGTASVQSRPGQGSEFTIALPPDESSGTSLAKARVTLPAHRAVRDLS